jgi:hypothetical protein
MDNRAPRRAPAAFFLAFSTGLVMLVMAGAAPVLRAELVVFTHGKVVKAMSHRDAGDRIEIHLHGGGSLTFDRALLERIEEDEVPWAEAQAPPVLPAPQPPRKVAASGPALTERVATPTEPQVSPDAPKASPVSRPSSRRVSKKRLNSSLPQPLPPAEDD